MVKSSGLGFGRTTRFSEHRSSSCPHLRHIAKSRHGPVLSWTYLSWIRRRQVLRERDVLEQQTTCWACEGVFFGKRPEEGPKGKVEATCTYVCECVCVPLGLTGLLSELSGYFHVYICTGTRACHPLSPFFLDIVSPFCLTCLWSCLPSCWSLCPPCLPPVSLYLRSGFPSCWSLCPPCLPSCLPSCW